MARQAFFKSRTRRKPPEDKHNPISRQTSNKQIHVHISFLIISFWVVLTRIDQNLISGWVHGGWAFLSQWKLINSIVESMERGKILPHINQQRSAFRISSSSDSLLLEGSLALLIYHFSGWCSCLFQGHSPLHSHPDLSSWFGIHSLPACTVLKPEY